MVSFQRIGSAKDIPPGSPVLINPNYLKWLDRNRGMWLSKREGYRINPFFDFTSEVLCPDMGERTIQSLSRRPTTGVRSKTDSPRTGPSLSPPRHVIRHDGRP